jgi:hypothetical protein
MGYRGDDATHGAWGRQTPWQSSPDDYPASDDGGPGYGPGDGYSGQGQAGYGQQGQQGQQSGQYDAPHGNDPYGQPPYGQYDDYQQPPRSGAGDYSGPGGYPQQQDYGYAPGPNAADPYGAAGYDSRPGAGYSQSGGYPAQGAGSYGQPSGYPGQGAGSYPAQGAGSYPDQGAGSYGQPSGYRDQNTGGYPGENTGYGQPGGYPAQGAGSYGQPSGYRDQNTGSYPGEGAGYGQPGGYQPQYPGSGGYPAQPGSPGGYPAEDAGNDWYGGQPAAANGASFADTGTYRLNGNVIDEYGTGPRGALRDPVRGYPPGPEQPGGGQLPTSVIPAVSGPQSFLGTGSQTLRRTGQQERYEENAPYPQYGQGQGDPGNRSGRGTGGFQSPAGRDSYDTGGDGDQFAGPGGQGAGDFGEATTFYSDTDQDAYSDYDAGGDPYLDQYGDGPAAGQSRAAGRGAGRSGPGRGIALGALGGKRLLFAAIAVVVLGVVGVAGYAFLFSSKSTSNTTSSQDALPSAGTDQSQQACVKDLGTYCHIEFRTDDPTPLTTAELFQPAFTNETDKSSYSLVSTKVDTSCANAVIGQTLITALKAGQCTQVLRASYVSGDNKIMGTIGVVNLVSTNEAHLAGKVVGQNDFIAPLTAAKGVASKLGNGTGVVEAEFKGHYLILTWSEFVNGTDPTTTAEDNQLERFSNDLVSGTANPDLSQRMVTGAVPATGASPSTTASASSAGN